MPALRPTRSRRENLDDLTCAPCSLRMLYRAKNTNALASKAPRGTDPHTSTYLIAERSTISTARSRKQSKRVPNICKNSSNTAQQRNDVLTKSYKVVEH